MDPRRLTTPPSLVTGALVTVGWEVSCRPVRSKCSAVTGSATALVSSLPAKRPLR